MKVNLSDFVKIQLIKNNEIIAEIPAKCNTWLTAGLQAIRDMSGDSGVASSYYINEMVLNGSEATVTPSNTKDVTYNSVAIFEGSYGTGQAINNIATIEIRHSGTIYSRITCTPFDKDTDTSLVINWRSTVGGDWYSTGRRTIASWLAYSISPVNEVGTIRITVTGPTSYNSIATYYASGNTIARWEATFTDLGGKTIDWLRLANVDTGVVYSEYDATNWVQPSGVDLIVKWETTFSAG